MDFTKDVQVNKVDQESELITVQGKNFSNSGILIESPVPIEIGAQVKIEHTDQNLGKPVIIKAQVVRVEKFDSHYDIGVSFLDIKDIEGNEIAQALAKNLGIPTNSLKKDN